MTNKFITLILCVLAFSSCKTDDDPSDLLEIVISGASINPEVGGPNEPNQVYVDLSTATSTVIKRDTWDLGFYNDSDFKVILNGSIFMAAAELDETDIDAVTEESVESLKDLVAVGTFTDSNMIYIDAPDGDMDTTAIAEISSIDTNNKVYLVNLGYKVGTETASTGTVEISGNERGWMKIRVLRTEDGYQLQYASVESTSHKEVNISKNEAYNFTFFSFDTESIVDVEPIKTDWDLNFTVFTNEIPGYGSYGYSDFVVNNTLRDVVIYMIDTDEENTLSYEDFSFGDIDESSFTQDRRSIGSSWRNGGGPSTFPSIKDNIFYILKDTGDNLYKVKFIALTNDAAERGYPEFVYKLLE
ncbi:HmuY family protein [Flavicella sp.]|uniref:HmuY family protein n=1 Tax=Flavicella sp. TaxID=2957742 RepID=UPI0030166C75